MQQIIINESTFEGCRSKILGAKAKYVIKPPPEKKLFSWKRQNGIDAANSGHDEVTGESADSNSRFNQPLALIIDGNSLVHALTSALEKDVSATNLLCANQRDAKSHTNVESCAYNCRNLNCLLPMHMGFLVNYLNGSN